MSSREFTGVPGAGASGARGRRNGPDPDGRRETVTVARRRGTRMEVSGPREVLPDRLCADHGAVALDQTAVRLVREQWPGDDGKEQREHDASITGLYGK